MLKSIADSTFSMICWHACHVALKGGFRCCDTHKCIDQPVPIIVLPIWRAAVHVMRG